MKPDQLKMTPIDAMYNIKYHGMTMAGNHISAFIAYGNHMEYYNHSNCSENGEVDALDTSDLHFFNSLT